MGRTWPVAIAVLAGLGTVAEAGIEDWQVNEVVTAAGGGTAARYVELRNDPGGCLFPSSRLEVFDGAGELVGAVAPVQATTCFGAGTYYLFATDQAATFFGTGVDEMVVPPLPTDAGQVCFVSSQTRYDCVRWGAVGTAVTDFFGADDTTSAAAPAMDRALERVATAHVVATDWSIDDPTPRGPNDGTPWFPPDAGPTPDAGPLPDAGPDAGPLPDARPLPDAARRPDARNDRFLDLEAVGGAACDCSSGPDPLGGWLVLVAVAVTGLRRRAR